MHTSTSQQIIFDGADSSVSFLDFVHQLEHSPGVDSVMLLWEIEHVVPTHLYGEALRHYEILDTGCQQNWPQLKDAMARRFPGGIRSGGLVCRSTAEWDESGILTRVESPPITFSKLVSPETVIDELEPPHAREGALEQKGSYLSLSGLKIRLRVPSFSRSPSRVEIPLGPFVTAYSMIIRFDLRSTESTPVTVDLTDPQAVEAAKMSPLITIGSSDENDRWLVGFSYSLLRGERSIDFCHKVLAPRKSKRDHFQQTGEQTVSPIRQRSRAFPITDFIHDPKNPNSTRKRLPHGTYTIQSHLRSRTPGTIQASEMENVGEITWILQVV